MPWEMLSLTESHAPKPLKGYSLTEMTFIGDHDHLAHVIEGLLADQARRDTLASGAHDHVVREFSTERMVARYGELYLALNQQETK